MKKFMQEGRLTDEVIQSIMEEEKPNQKEKPAFRDERITKLIPKSVPRGQEADFVVKALEFYNRHLQRSKDSRKVSHTPRARSVRWWIAKIFSPFPLSTPHPLYCQ